MLVGYHLFNRKMLLARSKPSASTCGRMKLIKRNVLYTVIVLCIACILALPKLISPELLDFYIKQISESSPSKDRWLSWSSSNSDTVMRNCSSPLKVYMYDLPRKYNMGFLEEEKTDSEVPWTDPRPPESTSIMLGVRKQHSVEVWLMVYLMNSWNRKDSRKAAVRVDDPEEADVFFVPFFSACSFEDFGRNMTHPFAHVDENLQAGIVDILFNSKWWQASQGRDHVLVVHHPNAFRHHRDVLNQSMFIVADFGRNKASVSRLSKDVVAPYVHLLPTYTDDDSEDPFADRKTLLYFQGRVRRKDEGKIRGQLNELLADQTDVKFIDSFPSADAFELSTESMRNSRFCLHPAGDTPSSCRLFDAIVNHCVPVIISDKIELPFEDVLNYSEFCLFFSSEEAVKEGHLLRSLRSYTREKWVPMWKKLKAVSHHFEYQHPAKEDDAVNMIFKEAQRKVPAIKQAVHRSKRLKIEDWWRRRR